MLTPRLSPQLRALGAAAALITLTGCVASLPASDSSPPTLHWSVTDLVTDSVQTIAGGGTVTMLNRHPVRILLNAEDPEGVQRVNVVRHAEEPCVGYSKHDAAKEVVLAPDQNNQVKTNGVLILVDSLQWVQSCDPDVHWPQHAHLHLNGSAENYYKGSAAGELQVVVW
jgi:hypothetical protein